MCHPPRDSYQQKGQGQSSGPQHPTGNQEVRRGGLREVHQQAVDPRVYEQLRPLPTDFAVTVSSSFLCLHEPGQRQSKWKRDMEFRCFFWVVLSIFWAKEGRSLVLSVLL